MKLFVKLMLALLVLAILLPFTLLKDEQGKPLMSFSELSLPEFKLPDLAGMPSSKRLLPSGNGSVGVDVFYKWYDGEGNVQFTTEPPAAGIEYTVKEFDPDANVIQSVRLPSGDSSTEAPAMAPSSSPGELKSLQDLGNPYDKDNIKKLFEDAAGMQKQLQQRLDNQSSDIN
jgi:hypothetical protein